MFVFNMDELNITIIDDEEEKEEDDDDDEVPVEMCEMDYIDFETAIHELLCDILADDILLYSDPAFHSNLKEDVLELYQNEWDNVMDMETYETFDLTIPEELKGQIKEGIQIVYWIVMDTKLMKQIKTTEGVE